MKGFKSTGLDKQPSMNPNKDGKKNTSYNFGSNRSKQVNDILEKYRKRPSK